MSHGILAIVWFLVVNEEHCTFFGTLGCKLLEVFFIFELPSLIKNLMDLAKFHLDRNTAFEDIDIVQVKVGIIKFDFITLLKPL